MSNTKDKIAAELRLGDEAGKLVLPSFDSPLPTPGNSDVGVKIGRVLDLDYDKWAVALIDLSDAESRPQRVAAERLRIIGKGYRKVGGNPVVGGFNQVEVYVMPRAEYERRREYRRERIENAVYDQTMQDSALAKAVTTSGQRANRRAG